MSRFSNYGGYTPFSQLWRSLGYKKGSSTLLVKRILAKNGIPRKFCMIPKRGSRAGLAPVLCIPTEHFGLVMKLLRRRRVENSKWVWSEKIPYVDETMILQEKRCRTCGVMGVGPAPVRLYPLDGYLYCERGTPKNPGCYREALAWDNTRQDVIFWLQMELAEPTHKRKFKPLEWVGFIHEVAELAGIALEHGDRKGFVHYAARALWAWTLKEIG